MKLTAVLPRGTGTRVADLLIPKSIKRDALSAFVGLANIIGFENFKILAFQRANVWESCIPPELRVLMIEHAGNYRSWIRMASEDLILDWMGEVKPDMVAVISENYEWFHEQVTDLKSRLIYVSD